MSALLPSHHTRAYLALGSNLGDRRLFIESAVRELRTNVAINVRRVSSIIETEPVGPPGQNPYLNAAVEVDTSLTPRQLLDACSVIEQRHGRERHRTQRWGPRTLDIDLLLYGQQIVDEPGLQVPHPRLAERIFVLQPLAEIAPNLRHPVLDATIQLLLERLQQGHPVEYGR